MSGAISRSELVLLITVRRTPVRAENEESHVMHLMTLRNVQSARRPVFGDGSVVVTSVMTEDKLVGSAFWNPSGPIDTAVKAALISNPTGHSISDA